MDSTHAQQPTALLVIDVQEGFDDLEFWGPTTNPEAEENIRTLVTAWRAHGCGPVVVVRHDSLNPRSPLHPASPGNRLKALTEPERADLVVAKDVNSAFYGAPDLHAWLQGQGIGAVVLCGIQTNMCVETSARMAGNLGYRVTVAFDATRTFDAAAEVPGAGEVRLTAAELMRASAVSLAAGGFARVLSTAEVIDLRS